MVPPPTLEDALAAHPSCARVQGLLFTGLRHVPTGESVRIGFRCFDATDEDLLKAFLANQPTALAALAPALNEDGMPAATLVRLEVAHTPSGGLVGVQPVRYVHYQPVPAAPARILEGASAADWAPVLLELDQSTPR